MTVLKNQCSENIRYYNSLEKRLMIEWVSGAKRRAFAAGKFSSVPSRVGGGAAGDSLSLIPSRAWHPLLTG
jgi:hypothetical protein